MHGTLAKFAIKCSHGVFLLGLCAVLVHATPQGVPGQVLVKFRESSEWASSLETIRQTTPVDFSSLSSLMTVLQDHVSVRFQPVQLLGSDILMCQIDSQWLADTLKHRLADVSAIEQVKEDSVAVPDRSLPGSGFPKVHVRVAKDTKESKLLTSSSSPTGFKDLVAIFEKHIHLPLQGEPLTADTLSLWVDLPSLTDTVIETLNNLPEVEFAQPNYRHAMY